MEAADYVWGGILLAAAAFEAYTLCNGRSGDTFSETTRRVFRTRTRVGAAVFGGLWTGFAIWYLIHILKG